MLLDDSFRQDDQIVAFDPLEDLQRLTSAPNLSVRVHRG